MKAKRIIPCLDINHGRVVKGINFVNLADVGDPAEIAAAYNAAGADEIVFLDISATVEGRKTMFDVISRAAKKVTVPLAVGGGISEIADIEKLFDAGAAKVSINSAAVKDPEFLVRAAAKFGSTRIVCAIDYTKNGGKYEVLISGGQINTGIDALEWAQKAERLGAGELLVTGLDFDGTKNGYDLDFLKAVCAAVNIPVTASGGAGKVEDFYEAAQAGAEGLLAASLFHFGEIKIPELKDYLSKRGIEVKR